MLNCRLVVLTQWPEQPTSLKKKGQFKVYYDPLLEDLTDELDKLGARDVVLQMDLPERKLRSAKRSYDGWPMSETSPTTPGIVLSFNSKRGPLVFCCDTYDEWKDNLRAISLTLERLRDIERYGAVRKGQQYKGFAVVATPPAPVDVKMLHTDAARLLGEVSGYPRDNILNSPTTFQRAYHAAAMKAHPDAGGSNELMAAVNEAAAVLRAYHHL